MKAVRIVNLTLVVVALLLSINLVRPISSITGNLAYSFDSSEPKCVFNNAENQNEIPFERCCYELQRQLTCKLIEEDPGVRCFISESSDNFYLINQKMVNLCKREGYNVPEA